MGFTTGFLGGFTLTSAVLYLTVAIHTRNRITQAEFLRQQRTLLNSVLEPVKPQPESTIRIVHDGLGQMAKDRWNRSLEEGLRKVYETDWRRVRENAEDRAGKIYERLRYQVEK